MIPEVGKTYDHFDDGKIKRTRRFRVKITEIVPFKGIDFLTLKLWQNEIEECDFLYNRETDYFVKGKVLPPNEKSKAYDYGDFIYVRTLDKNWFSLGYWAGVLDVDGSLMKDIQEERS